jgi:hypothetical protein
MIGEPMRKFFEAIAPIMLVLVPVNAFLALAFIYPGPILTWAFFGLAVAWMPAYVLLMLHIEKRRYRAFRRSLEEDDRRTEEALRRIWSLRYARRVRRVSSDHAT